MDYSEVCQGWIYCITNKVNGKKYIGRTNDFNNRKRQHFQKSKESCPILQRAIDKYGAENFIMEKLLTLRAINNTVLNKVLNWMERYYITKYDTYKNGYNATLGGEGFLGIHLKEETKQKISAWNKQNSDIGERSSIPILMYDTKGKFVCEFKSIIEAARSLGRGCNRSSADIVEALKGRKEKARGYMWRYKTEALFPLSIKPYIEPRSKTVYHYSKDGLLIGKFPSPKVASEELGISVKKIYSSAARDKRAHIRTDYWSYESPTT